MESTKSLQALVDEYVQVGKEYVKYVQSLEKGVDKMAEPTKKNPELEKLIDAFNPSGRKRIDSIKADICSWCGKPVSQFRDALSVKEYSISGFCQECQDKTFGD